MVFATATMISLGILLVSYYVYFEQYRKVDMWAGYLLQGIPPKEFDLLLHLAQNERLVLSREQLLNKVWGYDYHGDARTVDTHIKSLREHLGGRKKGTGIGLSIVSTFLKAHGMHYGVDCEEGFTTFWFEYSYY